MSSIKNIIEKILITVWIENNHKELVKICQSITKQNDIEDLLHLCILQVYQSKKFQDVPDKQKLYFFSVIVKNNFNSKSSAYYRQFKRKFEEIPEKFEIVEEEYKESPFNLEWVHKELKKMDWYYGRIFQLYIEENCNLTKLSKRTSIPANSLSRDIRKVKEELRKIREQQKDIY